MTKEEAEKLVLQLKTNLELLQNLNESERLSIIEQKVEVLGVMLEAVLKHSKFGKELDPIARAISAALTPSESPKEPL